MSKEDSNAPEKVKGPVLAEVKPELAPKVEEESTPLNIPPAPPKLAYLGDYFALARLLKDFDDGLLHDAPRLAWDSHFLTTPSMTYAFADLDAKLFGESQDIKDVLSWATGYVQRPMTAVCFYFPGWMPQRVKGYFNSVLRGLLTEAKGNPRLEEASRLGWGLIKKHSKKNGNAPATWRLYCNTFFVVVDTFERAGIDTKMGYHMHQICMVDSEDIIRELRNAYYDHALKTLQAKPFGPTVLWHVGHGPKPDQLTYTGLSFGYLTVENQAGRSTHHAGKKGSVTREAVLCRCRCGQKLKVSISDLLRGRAISCGKCDLPRTLTRVEKWASATLANAKKEATNRANRHPYEFRSPEELLYFAGVKPSGKGWDLGRTDDHLRGTDKAPGWEETPYAPGWVSWEETSQNRAVERKSVHNKTALFQQVMTEKLPEYDPQKAAKDIRNRIEAADNTFGGLDDSL